MSDTQRAENLQDDVDRANEMITELLVSRAAGIDPKIMAMLMSKSLADIILTMNARDMKDACVQLSIFVGELANEALLREAQELDRLAQEVLTGKNRQ